MKKQKITRRVIQIQDIPIVPPDEKEFVMWKLQPEDQNHKPFYFKHDFPRYQIEAKYDGKVSAEKFNGTMIRLTKEMQQHFNVEEKTILYIREDQHDFLQAMLIGNISFSNMIALEALESRVQILEKRYRFFEWVRNLFLKKK